MQIISKRAANKLIAESLFKRGGGTLSIDTLKFCGGKYKKEVIGQQVKSDDPKIAAIFAERRSDKHGAFFILKSLKFNN